MNEQYIARHDKAMRKLLQPLTKGRHGSFCLIADVGHAEGLRELGFHSKRVPVFTLPDKYMQASAHRMRLYCRGSLQIQKQDKARPDDH